MKKLTKYLIIAGISVSVFLGLYWLIFRAFAPENDFKKLSKLVESAIEQYGKDNVCVTIPQGGQIFSDGQYLTDNNNNLISLESVKVSKCP